MVWVKIFSSEVEAKQQIEAGKPQLLILHNKRICLVFHDNKFFAVQDGCTHNGTSLSKGILTIWAKSYALCTIIVLICKPARKSGGDLWIYKHFP